MEVIASPKVYYECGSISFYKHGETDRFVRDLRSFGKKVGITVKGHRYKCRDCSATFSETYSKGQDN